MKKSGRLGVILGTIGCAIIGFIGLVVIGYLFYLAGFSTSVINASEHTWLVEDSFWLNMLCGILVIGSARFACRKVPWVCTFVQRVNTDTDFYRLCRKRLLVLLGSLCVVILIVLQKIPVNDQRTICDIVNSMMNHDYYAFERGGYIDEYPNQLGMVLFLYGLAHIFGSYNYLFFQLLNVIALVTIYYTMSELSDWMGHSSFTGICILGMGILFFPAILYTTFVYGTLIGLCLSLRAFRNALKLIWFDRCSYKQRRLRLLLHKCLLLAGILFESWIAVVLKQNYMINAVALIIMSVLLSLRRGKPVNTSISADQMQQSTQEEQIQNLNKQNVKDGRLSTMSAIILIAGLFVILLFSGRVVTKAAEKATGIDIGSGISSLSWVAMGLQENSVRYDGWYNGYNVDSYHEANSSKERQEPVVIEYLQERIQEFTENPDRAIAFLAGKNASQWNNPDFQAFWCINGMRSSINYSWLIRWLLSAKGVAGIDRILNRGLFVVLLGAVMYCLLGLCVREKRENVPVARTGMDEHEPIERENISTMEFWDPVSVYYITVLIGGFVFHSFWEAKAQYTFPYFMQLLPVSVYGFEIFFHNMRRARQRLLTATGPIGGRVAWKKLECGCIKNPAVLAVLCLLLGGVIISAVGSNSGLLRILFLRTEDTEEYQQYMQDHTFIRLKEGDYLISVVGAPAGTESYEQLTVHLVSSDYDDRCWIFTEDNQTYMADDSTIRYSEDDVFPVAVSGITYSEEQSWYLRKTEREGEYYLIHVVDSKELVLTCNEDTGETELTCYDGGENQRWQIVEK